MERLEEYLEGKFSQSVDKNTRNNSIIEFENCILGFCLIGYLLIILWEAIIGGVKSVLSFNNHENNK